MVESESSPVEIRVIPDSKKEVKNPTIRDVHPGQNTMIIQDNDFNIYKTGLKLDYSPKEIEIFG